MPGITLTCPECGKTGSDAGDWVKPGVAAGPILTGLNTDDCEGCRETLRKHGYTVLELGADGTARAVSEDELNAK